MDINEAISPILSAAKLIAVEKGILLSVVDGGGVDNEKIEGKVNPRALRECLANVVDNAMKYCRSDGDCLNMRITVSPTTTDINFGPSILVENDNCGLSIPNVERELIFERNYRAKSAWENEIDGTGLGLGIARGLMRRMGGDLRLVDDDEDSEKQLDIAFRILMQK